MRVAALFDIHGNLPALEAVLDELEGEGVDTVVIGGDVASGPMPAETLDLLASLHIPVRFVRGNADRELLQAGGGEAPGDEGTRAEALTAWAAGRMEGRHRELLETFAPSLTLAVDGLGEVCFCHASPRSDEEIITRATPDSRLAAILEGCTAPLIVAGHTHIQLDRTLAGHRFVNAGSVGMPYEDEAGAYWALLGPDVSLRRSAYDYASAAQRIRASGYPGAEELIRECLLVPIGREEATRQLEEMARGMHPARNV